MYVYFFYKEAKMQTNKTKEERQIYIANCVYVRKECFNKYSSWLEPTATEVRYMIDKANIKQTELSKILGVDPRTVRRWVLGELKIGYLPWCVICSYCGIKELWD